MVIWWAGAKRLIASGRVPAAACRVPTAEGVEGAPAGGRRAVAILEKLFPNGHTNLDIARKNLGIIEKAAKNKKRKP